MSSAPLARRPGLAVAAVTCAHDHAGWSPPEVGADFRVVLVRRGRFRRRVRGRAADADPTVGFVALPADEEHFAHPAGGDVCTSVSLRPSLWGELTGDVEPAGGPLYIDARVDLAHRRLLRAAGAGDVEYAVVERLVVLLAGALWQGRRAPVREALDAALVRRAREAVLAGDPAAAGLLPLATVLEVSPYRLSRAFTRHLGVSLTRYRNRVRVGRALDRLEAGADDLAGLAADLGFADQAHLCRALRDHVGCPPSAVRAMFA